MGSSNRFWQRAANCLNAAEDTKLSEELTSTVYDCLCFFRGLQVLLQRKATPSVMSETMVKALQHLKVSSHKPGDKNVCARTAGLIAKDQFAGEWLKEFVRFDPGIIECRLGFEIAYHALLGETEAGAGTLGRHEALMTTLSSLFCGVRSCGQERRKRWPTQRNDSASNACRRA